MAKLQRGKHVIGTALLVVSLLSLSSSLSYIGLQAASPSTDSVSRSVWRNSLPTILPSAANTTPTCQSYQNQGYNFTQAAIAGDSMMNWSTPETELLQQLTANGIAVSPAGFTYTISGSGNDALLSTLQSGVLDSDIASSDLFILNRGVNDWSTAVSNMAQVEGWIDSNIAYIKGINPNIVIFWIEPHAVAGLVSNPNVATGALSVAAYLNAKDAAGDICLVDWSSYADANPSVYTNLTDGAGNPSPADGIHIYGNEQVYFAELLTMIQSVEQTSNSNSPPSVTISAPADNSTLIFGTAINLLASATDVEDGDLTSSIFWTSSIDGAIGSGGNISTTTLSLGLHTLSAEVMDSAGVTTTATITTNLLPNSPQIPAPTCQSYQNQGYNFTQAAIAGDSMMNWSTPETELLQQLTANGIAVSPAGFTYTISGSGNGDLLTTLQSGVLDSDIASSDLFILNRGVNDWSPAVSNMPQVEGWIDSNIAYIKGINPNIVIFWIEPHAVAGLVSNPNVATGALSVAAYLNAKDAAGDICLVDWSSYADANPSVYINLIDGAGNPYPADGIQIYGNEQVYFAQLLTVIQSVEQTSNSPPSVTISAPADSSTLIYGTAINLLASATDVEDGDLTSSILWTSSIDGAIGSGGNISTTTLSLGLHTLSTEVMDSAGVTTTATITINLLLDTPQMLAPIGSVATPSPTFEWTSVNGATNYEIAIYNVATDSVDFLSTHSAAAVGCSSGTANCSIQPVTLTSGSYTWLVRATNGSHFSSWAVHPSTQ